jgi:hypothetical protein
MVDDELHAHVNEELKAMGAFLSGRVTYEYEFMGDRQD